MKSVDVATLQEYVGKPMGESEWFQIDQDRINNFADATLDHQFIHVDPEKAKNTPFGGTIAHGFLTLSLLPHLQSQMGELIVPAGLKMGMNYGFDKIRFLAPVKTGAKVRAVATLKSVTEKNPGQFLFAADYVIEIEGESKPALMCEWLLMYFV